MGIFQISAVDNAIEAGRRKRILLVTEDFHDVLFLIQHFLVDNGHCVLTKPLELSGYKMIDWYSDRVGLPAEKQDTLIMPSDPVQFFATLKKIDGIEKLFFHLTPVLLLYEKETATALLENICAYCEEKGIALLVLIEKPEIFEEVVGAIKHSFDYFLNMANGKLTITSLKRPDDDVELHYGVRESDVVLRTPSGIERCNVSWSGGKNLFWLPGSELLFPTGVSENYALLFCSDTHLKQYLIEQAVSDSIFSGKPCIFVSGETTLKEFTETLKTKKKLELLDAKNFVFVDWFSSTTKKITGAEDREKEIVVSRDIVYLSVAIDWALRRFDGKGVLILDCLTTSTQIYSTEEICNFLATVIARAKRKGYSILSFGNLEVIGRERVDAFACFFDGNILLAGKRIHMERSDTFFYSKRKFGLAVAAGVLSIIPEFEKEVELSEEEIARVLKTLDELLGNLPEEKISEFAMSEEFKLYEKLLKKYGI
ncbi:MAG: hypothetical protein QXU48_04930 [Thermoplasmata archaeon]